MRRVFIENPQCTSTRKVFERNGFNRPDAQTTLESRVMHDHTAADIDAVMRIAGARTHDVRARAKLGQQPTRAAQITYCAVLVSVHGFLPSVQAQTLAGSPIRARRHARGLSPTTRRNNRLRCA